MDAQDRLEAHQAAEMERRNKLRRVVRTVSCPECKAVPNAPCTGSWHRPRVHNHKARMTKARNLGLIEKRDVPNRGFQVHVIVGE